MTYHPVPIRRLNGAFRDPSMPSDDAAFPDFTRTADLLSDAGTLPPGFRLWAAVPSGAAVAGRPSPRDLPRLPLKRGQVVLVVSGDSTVLTDLAARIAHAQGQAVPQAGTRPLPPLGRIALAIVDLDGDGDPDDAIALCLRMRRARPDLAIVALDSAVQVQAGATALAMGACDALAPPADRTTPEAAAALAAAVGRVLHPQPV